MNLVTKSGSNQFHGQAAYLNQNSALAARQFFDDAKAKVLIHTIREHLRHGGQEHSLLLRLGERSEDSQQTVLPAGCADQCDARRGFFATAGTANARRDQRSSKRPAVPNNVIPASRISAVSQAVNQGYLPAPSRGGADALASNFGFRLPFQQDYHLRKYFTQHIDYQVTAKTSLWAAWIEDWASTCCRRSSPRSPGRACASISLRKWRTLTFSRPPWSNSARVGFYKEKYTDGDPLHGVTPFKGDLTVKEIGLQGVNPRDRARNSPACRRRGYGGPRRRP